MTFDEIISSDQPVLIDFYATWCGPCQTLAPILKEVADRVKGKAKVIKIDIDKNQKLAQKHQVMGVPTLMLFKSGEKLWQQSGVLPASELTKIIEQHA